CTEGADCGSGVCGDDGLCTGGACADGVHNGDETDVDCGGSCDANCPDGGACQYGSDCASNVCDAEDLVCLPPTCTDGAPNGDETDVDCGGSCEVDCLSGLGCLADDDCQSGVCGD